MLILYTGTTCPFCRRVEDFLDNKGIEYDARNVHESDGCLEELLQEGGKRQIPFLVDSARGVNMYESADIIQYVADTYGTDPVID